MNIKIVRLISGEEVIASVERGMTLSQTRVINPMLIVPTEQRSIALAPWMPYAEMSSVDINSDMIIFSVDPQKELADYYEQTVTGLVTKASPQILQG